MFRRARLTARRARTAALSALADSPVTVTPVSASLVAPWSAQHLMAATGMDAVIALTQKALELRQKMRPERSLEKWRAALAAAEALGEEDSIVVAALTTEVARSMFWIQHERRAPLSRAFILEHCALNTVSASILQRRRDAGTLLDGTCRPSEVRWRLEFFRSSKRDPAFVWDEATMIAAASLVGHDEFLGVCACSARLLSLVAVDDSFQAVDVGQQQQTTALMNSLCERVEDAAALLTQPRPAPAWNLTAGEEWV